ncbi:MAG: hypothetical protein R3C40_11625 [Parvularculaceae bacterium]
MDEKILDVLTRADADMRTPANHGDTHREVARTLAASSDVAQICSRDLFQTIQKQHDAAFSTGAPVGVTCFRDYHEFPPLSGGMIITRRECAHDRSFSGGIRSLQNCSAISRNTNATTSAFH